MNEQFVLDRIRDHGGFGTAAVTGSAAGSRSGAGFRRPDSPPSAQRGGRNETPGNGTASQQRGRDGKLSGGDAAPAAAAARYEQNDPVVNVERQALKLAVQRPALCGPAFDELSATVFTVPAHAAVRELITACGGVSQVRSARDWAEQLRAAAPNDNARGFVTRLAVEPLEAPGLAAEPDARYTEAVLARVEELSVSREIAVIKSRLQRLSPVTELGEYNRMFGDLVALEQRRKVLSDRAGGAL
jgi:DNA primase